MSQVISNEIIGEFIEIYKSEPCLWKIKSSEYHDRDRKDAAYRKLVMKLKEIDPDANVELTDLTGMPEECVCSSGIRYTCPA